ncbi:hypothetical protein BDQ17DRAFT_1542724 [Cyathus striatus]|nr:hypothetical protein BDQ17DRAFT_1542724 [Cyathus striatus]
MVLRASGDGVSLRLYIPAWVESSTQMLQVLQNIPHLTSLMIASTGIQHDKWSKLLIQHFQFQGILNDNLLSALSPAGKNVRNNRAGIEGCVKARRDAHLRDLWIAPLGSCVCPSMITNRMYQ